MIERAARVAAPAALALFVVIGAVQSERSAVVRGDRRAGGDRGRVVISWRGLTGWPLVAALAVPAAGLVGLCHGNPSSLGWFGMCVIAGWAAFGAAVVPGLVAGAALVAGFVVEWLALGDEPGWGAWIAGTTSPPRRAPSAGASASSSKSSAKRRPSWPTGRAPTSATGSRARCTTSSATHSPSRCCT